MKWFFRSASHLRLPLLLVLSGLLGACAQLQQRAVPPESPEPGSEAAVTAPAPDIEAAPIVPDTALTAPLLYDILLGEIAGQRGALDVSLPHLLRAAQDSSDPRIAERALRVAVYAKQQGLALQAARRWVELDGDNLEARQALAALALREGRPDEALEQLDYLLSRAGDQEDRGYEQLSALLAREPDADAALEVMGELATRHADNPHAQLAHARLAAHNEDWPLALDAVQRALALDPRLTDALVLRARVLLQQERMEEALDGLKTAVAAQPDNTGLRLAYARLLVEAEQVEASREQFRLLARQQPDNPDVLYPLALLALEAEQYQDAEGYLRKLLKLGKHETEALYYLGHIAETREDYEQALDWYSRVDSGDQWLEVQIRMARLEAQLDRMPEARARLQHLRSRDPANTIRLYLVEGELLSMQKQYQEALELYNRVLAIHPDQDDVLYHRSLIAEKLDRIDLAESDLRSILSRNPEDARALNALGYTLADRTDRYQEALGYIEKAIALEPDDPAVIDSLGWVHYRLGNLELARQHLQRAYDLNQDAEIAAHLGEVLWMMGEREAARRIWDQARETAPDNRVLQATLKRLLP